MKSLSSLTLVAATLLVASNAQTNDGLASEGCFSSTVGLTFNTTWQFNSKGYCNTQCGTSGLGQSVFALTNSTWCYCGDNLPPASSKVDDDLCTTTCPGYPANICGGGSEYLSVYLTAGTTSASNANADGSSPDTAPKTTPSATTSAKPSVVTISGQTVVVTASGSPSPSAASSGGTSKAGIAAGVVVGLLAIAAIAGGIFFFIRNKQRREVEEEYRRNAAVSSFMNGAKHPPTSSGGGSSFADMRLDPAVMAQRRMSDGSIADNQDYSRRILKVTNA